MHVREQSEASLTQAAFWPVQAAISLTRPHDNYLGKADGTLTQAGPTLNSRWGFDGWGLDGGNDTTKDVVAVRPRVPSPRMEFVRCPRLTPKTGQLSRTKDGEQKYAYVTAHPEEWDVITDKTLYEWAEMLTPGSKVRIEPDFGSYHRDRDEVVRRFRSNGILLEECDAKLSARQRLRYRIPVEEVSDETDAILIWDGKHQSFARSRLSDEKVEMDRGRVVSILERSEESKWADDLSKEALAAISAVKIGQLYGTDLAQPVFIVTAYTAAMDPQCVDVKDFDRFCGLAAKFRSRGKRGVGSVISSNLSHFQRNPRNRTAARYIFHQVKRLQSGLTPNVGQRSR